MADRLPISEGEPKLPSSVPLGQLKHSAEWADTFRGQDTNFVQRARHNADIGSYTKALQAEHDAELQRQYMTDKDAQNFYFKSKKLKMDEDKMRADLDLRDQQFKFREELHPLEMEAKRVATARTAAQTKAAADKLIHDASEEIKSAEDTSGLIRHIAGLRAKGLNERSPEWAINVADGVDAFSAADMDLRRRYAATVLKGEDVSKLTPEQISEKVATLKAQYPDQQFRLNARGEATVNTLTPDKPKPDKPVDPMQEVLTEKKRLTDIYGTEASIPAPVLAKLQAKLAEAEKKYVGGEAAPTAAGTTAAPPQNQAALAWLTANPDDPRAPAIRAKLGVK